MVPEATDDASLGRVYAANGSIPAVKDVPDKVFELLDFQLLGRRIRSVGGRGLHQAGVCGTGMELEAHRGPGTPHRAGGPTGFFRLELQLGEERAELTLPPDRSWWRCGSGWRPWAPQLRRHRLPQPGAPASGSVGHAGAAGYLNCLAIRLMVLAERDSLALIKYKAVLEVSSISSLEDAMALTERWTPTI